MKKAVLTFVLLLNFQLGAQVWEQIGDDIAGINSSDFFGEAVSMNHDGSIVAVGAKYNDDSFSSAGHIRIFEWDGANWNPLGSAIAGIAPNDNIGKAIDLSDDGHTLVIGVRDHDLPFTNTGYAEVYNWDGISWNQKGQTIAGAAASDGCGYAVAISGDGDRFIVSSPSADPVGNNSGYIRAYDWDGVNWVQVGSNINGIATTHYLGTSLAFSDDGNIFVAGGYLYSGAGNVAGSIQAYEWNGVAWNQKGALIPGETDANYFGWSSSINGDGNIIAGGAILNDGGGTDSGHIRIFEWNGVAWAQKGADIDGTAAGDKFGMSVDLNSSGLRIVGGAAENDDNGNYSGHTRVFDWNGAAWVLANNTIVGPSSYDREGYSVSMNSSGDYFITGANQAQGGGVLNQAGIVRIFGPCGDSVATPVISCGSYTWIDGNTYSNDTTAYHTLTNAQGCDSVIILQLTLGPIPTTTDYIVGCDSIVWMDGNTYTSSNTSATHMLTSSGGCDSLIQLNLTINYSIDVTDEITACSSYTWIDGNTYTSSNSSATHILSRANGCDSTVHLDLTVNYPSPSTTDTQNACNSLTWINGITYTSDNSTDSMVLTNVLGCDSVVYLDLTVTYVYANVDTISACDSYTWPIDGITYTASDTVIYSTTLGNGCDSTQTLYLTINYSSVQTDTIVACNTYTWIDGNTYTSNNNTATHTLASINGCDSIIELDLTIKHSSYATHTITACYAYQWVDGFMYTSNNNTAIDTLLNAVGCDSIVSLDLTIITGTSSIDVVSACDSYTWIDGNTYTSNNSTASMTLTGANGCDSTVTLDLTINPSYSFIEMLTACDSLTWINGTTYYANTSDSINYSSINGCDSTIYLSLIIHNSSSYTDIVTACENYTWIDGNTYSASTTTSTTIQAVNGCDSLITLDLTIITPYNTIDSVTACDSYLWIDGNTYTNNTSTPTVALTAANGCDSIVNLVLNINSIDLNVTLSNPLTLTANESNASYQWLDCDDNMQAILGETNQSLTTNSNGSYALSMTSNGCIDTTLCYNISQVSAIELNQSEIRIYPNPTHDGNFSIDLEGEIDKIIVSDIMGRIIPLPIDLISGKIDGSSLATGKYTVRVITNDSVFTKEIIVIR